MYAMIGTRPDIAYAVSLLARFCEAPRMSHWNAVKRVFRYLSGTAGLGIEYRASGSNHELSGFSDADFAMDIDTRKSIAGYVVKLNGGSVVWRSTKESQVALSTTEAEYIAASMMCKEVLWARQLLKELGKPQLKPSPIYVDNQGAVKLIRASQVHARTKHIDVLHMFVRDAQRDALIDATFVGTKEQIADVLTKGLSRDSFERLRDKLGLN